MKWSSKYVWSKVDEIIPHVKAAETMDLPQALREAAVELFMKVENGTYRAYVISECLHELKHWGRLSFGTIEQDEVVS